MEIEKAGLLEQLQRVAARVRDIDQKLAKLNEYEQLAAEFNFGLVDKSGSSGRPEVSGSQLASLPAPSTPAPLPKNNNALIGITLGDLIDKFLTDPRSSHQKLRFKTRDHSRSMHERIKRERGQVLLSSIGKSDLESFYKEWSAGGIKLSVSHSLMGRLRALLTFGGEILENEDCQRLSGVFRSLHFEPPRSCVEKLTAEQANAIRRVANEKGRFGIALAQAFQFGTGLRQGDVIGEYVPLSEPGISLTINKKGQKWLRGIRWDEIDSNLILTHVTSARQKTIKVDLKTVPMVIEELGTSDRSKLPGSGPIIISETTGYPYYNDDFRRKWRAIADAAGIPKSVKNMDSMRPDSTDEETESEAGAAV